MYVAAILNRKLQLPEDSSELYEIDNDKEAALEAEFQPHTDTFRSIIIFHHRVYLIIE